MILLIDRGVTTLTTTLKRVNHYRYLVFMGNCNGVIGYGKGKGVDFEEALDNAILHCKKNLIAIPID
jgi:ribosomal protein S5